MDLDNDSYSNERSRNDLALRMIRHEARTCTIRECTGLTDDRIRRLYKSYAHQLSEAPVRRRRGRSPRQFIFFVRNTRAQFESSLLAGAFAAFGLLCVARSKRPGGPPDTLDYGRRFCDAYETHQQLFKTQALSFEHAWFLLQLLNRSGELRAVRCRHCDSYYLKDKFNLCRHTCPTCRLKGARVRRVEPSESCTGSRAVMRD